MRRAVCLLAPLLLLSACATSDVKPGANARSESPRKIVESYLAALNRRDLLALTAYTTVDVEWYTVLNGERTLEVSGRDALAKSLELYFDRYSGTRWTIKSAQTHRNQVAVLEQSSWDETGGAHERTSLGVYELADGRIRRITFYLEET